jgi:DNA-binding PadR family transcriptional regulator
MKHDIPGGAGPRRRRPDDPSDRPMDARPQRGHRRGRGGGRMARGDVRSAILLLLADEPMHGYQLMTAIAERSGGRWTPSPGAIYPALNQLEDEGLVTVTAESGRKVAALTDEGRAHLATTADTRSDPFEASDDARPGHDLRGLLGQLHEAARQVGRTGTDAQAEAAAKVLTDARRSLYLILADGPESSA